MRIVDGKKQYYGDVIGYKYIVSRRYSPTFISLFQDSRDHEVVTEYIESFESLKDAFDFKNGHEHSCQIVVEVKEISYDPSIKGGLVTPDSMDAYFNAYLKDASLQIDEYVLENNKS